MAIADKQDLQFDLKKRGFDVNNLLRENRLLADKGILRSVAVLGFCIDIYCAKETTILNYSSSSCIFQGSPWDTRGFDGAVPNMQVLIVA